MAPRQQRVLLLPPNMTHFGGTELETLIIAKTLLSGGVCQQVEIFTRQDVNDVIRSFVKNENIIFRKIPRIINNRISNLIDRLYNKITTKNIHHKSLVQSIYWSFKSLLHDYRHIIIIGANNQFFYLNAISIFDPAKVIVRYTTVYEQFNYTPEMLYLLGRFSLVLTTSEAQKKFVDSKTNLMNIKNCDVFIHNESSLLNLTPQKSTIVRFGMLARISTEKNIEDAIYLVHELIKQGKTVSLTINGPCYDRNYLLKLSNLIQELQLTQNIRLTPTIIPIENVPIFFSTIDVFLITSQVEGGPNTGLESIAAGIPCLSYDVGAMKERLKYLSSELICTDFNALVAKATALINLDDNSYKRISQNLKNIYNKYYCNKIKLEAFLSDN